MTQQLLLLAYYRSSRNSRSSPNPLMTTLSPLCSSLCSYFTFTTGLHWPTCMSSASSSRRSRQLNASSPSCRSRYNCFALSLTSWPSVVLRIQNNKRSMPMHLTPKALFLFPCFDSHRVPSHRQAMYYSYFKMVEKRLSDGSSPFTTRFLALLHVSCFAPSIAQIIQSAA